MTAHIRLVSSEGEDPPGLDGEAIGVDEAPVGLPEEAGPDKSRPDESRRDEMLGEAAPPLVAEPEDRAGGSRHGRERPKGALARLIAFARPRKAKAAAAIMEAGSAEAEPESETALGKRGNEDAGADPIVVPAAGATAVANGAEFGVGSAGPATAAAKPRRPLFARKGAIAVVLMTGVAAAAIMVLNWPHGSHPQAVEPGMLADQPTKVMAPSAALATVPPREEPNVAGERPQVHETRRDEFQEVLSFKGLKATASPPAASPPPTPSPVGGPVTVAKPAVPTAAPPAAAVPPDPPCGRADAYGLRPDVAARVRRARCGLETRKSRLAPATRFGSRRCHVRRPCACTRSPGTRSWRSGEDRVAPWRAGGGDKGTVERDGDARRPRQGGDPDIRPDRAARGDRDASHRPGEGLAGSGPDRVGELRGEIGGSDAAGVDE